MKVRTHAAFAPHASVAWGTAMLLLAAALLLGTAATADELPAGSDSLHAPIEANADSVASPVETPAAGADSTKPANPSSTQARIISVRKVKLVESDDNVARTGPGDGYAIAGVYPRNSTFTVIAKSGDWYNVRLSPTETGWIHASLCREFDDMSDLEFQPNPKLYSRTGAYMLTGYAGAYAFDRKSNSFVAGGRLGYYIFDRLQAELGVAWTRVKRPAEIVESLFDLSLEAEDFHMLFYHLALNYELLPGRQMVPYLTGGVGSTIMRGETEASFNYGAGTMLYLSKHSAVRWEVRSYRFKSGSDDARVVNNNVEFTMGTTFLF